MYYFVVSYENHFIICDVVQLNKIAVLQKTWSGENIFNTHNVEVLNHSEIQKLRSSKSNHVKWFDELNKPYITDDADFQFSYRGEYGCVSNEEADKESFEEYGFYFDVFIFLDQCDTYFRGSQEEDEEEEEED